MKSIQQIVDTSRTSPGDPWDVVVKRGLLPPIPPEVTAWIQNKERPPGLYLQGPFKSGKTWIGAFAAMSLGESDIGFWSEGRYTADFERKRWYDRMLAADPRNTDLWVDATRFETEFLTLQLAKVLIIDDLYYGNLSDYKQSEMDSLLKMRLDRGRDLGMFTIICAARMPAPGTLLARQLFENADSVTLKALS